MSHAQVDTTAAEQEKRRKAWETANASVLMEGGVVDDETRAMQERHIKGEITMDDYLAWAREAAKA